jgi:hypothetical protein
MIEDALSWLINSYGLPEDAAESVIFQGTCHR